MSIHYQLEIVFPVAYNEAKQEIIAMQGELNSYKRKKDYSEKWAEEKQQRINVLMEFVKTCVETFELLERERIQAKRNGYAKGKEDTEKEYKHWETYGHLKFDNPKHKEQIRAISILEAQEQWNF